MDSSATSPIFVCGPMRSGTTLVGRMLDRHSQVAIANEFDFFDGLAQHCEGKSREQMLEAWQAHRSAQLQKLDPEGLRARLQALPAEPRSLMLAALEQNAQQHGKVRAGEKCPLDLLFVETLLRWFPQAQILVIIRDGRDTALSLSKMPEARANLMTCALRYRDYAREILALQSRYDFSGPRLRLVSYEALLQDPEPGLRAIDSWLGLDFEPAQLQADPPKAFPKQGFAWMKLASKPVDPSRQSSWRSSLSDVDRWRINAVIGPELRAFGYLDTDLTGCPPGRRALIQLEKALVHVLSWSWVRVARWVLAGALLRLGVKRKTLKDWGF
jgi:hypothetical protein